MLFSALGPRHLLGKLRSWHLHPNTVCPPWPAAGSRRPDAGAPASALRNLGGEGRVLMLLIL